jgi:GntR family transcriptional regulator / MocR family aminotransferase
MHLVAYLRDSAPSSDVDIEQAALRAGIVVRALSRLYISAPPRPALMLGFSGFPRQVIIPAAIRLAKIVKAAYSSRGLG